MFQIQAVIFDLDGLMIDSEPLSMQAWKELLADFGVELEYEVFKQTIGLDSHASSVLLKAKYGLKEGVNYLVERSESMRLRIIEKEATPADGLEDLLKLLLGKGIKLGVASNSPSDYVHAALGAIRVRHFFDCVLSVDDVKRGKPAPDLYLAVAEGLSVDPEKCMAIEDSPSGMRSALAAGMRCVVVPSSDFEAADYTGASSASESLVHLADQIEAELRS
jgi:HAD superfamily hydrolase (TIGR01509 family)